MEFAVVASIVCLVAAVLIGVVRNSITAARPYSCLFNLKSVAGATLQYSEDYDGELPLRTWIDGTYKYTKSESVYCCPGVDSDRWPAYGYAFEQRALGAKRSDVTNAENQPLVYDSWMLTRNAVSPIRNGLLRTNRHHRNAVAFLDGHGQLYNQNMLDEQWPPPMLK